MQTHLTLCDIAFDLDASPSSWRAFAKEEFGAFFEQGHQKLIRIDAQSVKGFAVSGHERAHVEAIDAFPYLQKLELAVGLKGELVETRPGQYQCIFKDVLEPKMALENFIRVFLANYLPCDDKGLMLHGSCGIYDDKGIIFAGISTAGKTTLSDNFKNTTYLSDDISIIKKIDTVATLVPHPFHGKSEREQIKRTAPLKAICILGQKSEKTTVRRLSFEEAFQMLPRHIVTYAKSAMVAERVLCVLEWLLSEVSVFYVERNLDDMSADELVKKVITQSSNETNQTLKVA